MKRKALFFLVIITVALLQITVLNPFALFGVKPDLLLLLVVICGLYFSPGWALGYSMVAGCCQDVFTASGWGINTVLFCALSVLLVALHKRMRFDSRGVRLSVVYLSCLAYYVISGFCIPRVSTIPTGIFLRTLLLGPVYDTLIFFWILRWIDAAMKPFAISFDNDEEPDFDPDFEAYV